ncbi:MAG: phosphoserine phosphatase SerB [Desulfovibrio sp.]|nr:MAG: phosphoserine phosphatase SerB [Desulfovibrio sp.]
MQEILLVRITGDDSPGLTAKLAGVLDGLDVDVLDIGQAVIHETLSLGMLIRIPEHAQSAPVVKDLLFKAHELGVHLTCTPVRPESYEAWTGVQGKQRFIATLIARRITAAQVAAVSRVISENGLNIDVITRLSGRPPLTGNATLPACVEFSLRGTPQDVSAVRKAFLAISAELGVDIAFQEDNAFRRNRRLVAFDMDSTLVQAEFIDELAVAAGKGKEVSEVTARAMRGEMDFSESLAQRMAFLKGLPESALAEVAARVPLTEGAERLIRNLKKFGYKTAIISGGFTYFGHHLQQRLGVDYVYANELDIEDGKLTGRVRGRIVDGPRKAELLRDIAAKEDISLQQAIAVGDGANDLPMLNIAGLGIAFHAKPLVKEGAGHSISTLGLDAILFLAGIRSRDMSQ